MYQWDVKELIVKFLKVGASAVPLLSYVDLLLDNR